MQIVRTHSALWLKNDTGNKCDSRLWCQLWVRCCINTPLRRFNLVKSKEYTVQSYNINPGQETQPAAAFYKLTAYGFAKPYAARCRLFSQISLLSFHCQSRLGFYMILILMDVFQCEITQPGVNVDQPLPPTTAIW